jgi:uncharacterized membrane protein
MPVARARVLFALLLVGAALFIVLTAQALPGVVASHFGASGRADAYMTRGAYRLLMLLIAVAVPLGIVLLQALVRRRRSAFNLPHREYWLSPERRDATLTFLDLHTMAFAALLVVFLGFVHWLVVRANAAQPPRLESGAFVTALVLFLAATAVWVAVLYLRFRRRP